MTVYYTVARRQQNIRAAKDEHREQILPRLLEKLGINPHQELKRDENGRLFLPNSPTIDINLSHADPYTVYAAGDTRIGIDIECPDRIREPEKLARRFFTDAEQRQIAAANDPSIAACEIWTKKEALAKHIGTGLAKNIHTDTTFPPNDLIFHTFHTTMDSRLYILTLCTCKEAKIIEIEI